MDSGRCNQGFVPGLMPWISQDYGNQGFKFCSLSSPGNEILKSINLVTYIYLYVYFWKLKNNQ